ncbi:MAG: gluconate 2-dehydrogenase subunit 3 family protein [Verrucomicrobiaceae bacterium]|nr:gluconate 2-dehydrogenase subunit 3 family protein [Verrucomicrobiaceae bacterium]
MNRRHALKWLTGSAAGAATAPIIAAPGATEPAPPAFPARFTFHDPDFSKPITGPWERLLTESELSTTKVLADIILPKDEHGPAASEIGVHDFINEWISAPYPDQREDCEVVRGGLAWINTESFRRFAKPFAELSHEQQISIIDEIAAVDAKPEHAIGAAFFKEFRHLCLGGYYTHSSTWQQLGYVGNISVGGPYPGVPQEIIEKLGLQDVA